MKQIDQDILDIITKSPGISGYWIGEALRERHPAPRWATRIFAHGSIWLEFFYPSSGTLYAALIRLEERHLIVSQWGDATAERGWKRPRLYFVR